MPELALNRHDRASVGNVGDPDGRTQITQLGDHGTVARAGRRVDVSDLGDRIRIDSTASALTTFLSPQARDSRKPWRRPPSGTQPRQHGSPTLGPTLCKHPTRHPAGHFSSRRAGTPETPAGRRMAHPLPEMDARAPEMCGHSSPSAMISILKPRKESQNGPIQCVRRQDNLAVSTVARHIQVAVINRLLNQAADTELCS